MECNISPPTGVIPAKAGIQYAVSSRDDGRLFQRRRVPSLGRLRLLDARFRGHDGGGCSAPLLTRLGRLLQLFAPCFTNAANAAA